MSRYTTQEILPEFGNHGQELISSSSVLIVGAGGLGTIVASYLASMGVGKIGICDFDSIVESNLHRQFQYAFVDISFKKAEVLTKKLRNQNPSIDIHSISEKLQKSNIDSIVSDYQIICDCSDNSSTRLLLNKCCVSKRITLVHGAVSDWQGYLTVFHYRKKYDLRDLFDTLEYLQSETCSINGINSSLCGIIGSHMVNEVIKIILKLDTVLEGSLLYVNGLKNIYKFLKIKKTNLK